MAKRIVIQDSCAVSEGEWDHKVHLVFATTKRGERFVLHHRFKTYAKAEATAIRVMEDGTIDPELWNSTYPVYGSAAYEDESFEASMYADSIRAGHMSEADVPDYIRTLL